MSKKKGRLKKTQVEQILDKNKIPYKQVEFPTVQDGDVRTLKVDHQGSTSTGFTRRWSSPARPPARSSAWCRSIPI